MVACALSLLGSGCRNEGDLVEERGSALTFAYCCGDRVLNPMMDTNARLLVFLPLVGHDEQGEFEGRLARSWEHSPDFREWTYHLRTDVYWHDGIAVTAEDVKFTIDLWGHPDVGWYGAADSTEVLDDSTVVVRYRDPTDALRYQPWLVYYPKHLLEGFDPASFFDWEFWARPVGNGPYRFVRLVPETMMVLEANPDHYRRAPKIQRVVLKFVEDAGLTELLSGGVDVLPEASPEQVWQLADNPRFQIHHTYLADWGLVIYWQHQSPLFQDRRARRALTLAVDRRELLRVLRRPETTPIVDGPYTVRQLARGELPDPVPYDPAEARRLLDAAGWIDRDGDGLRDRDGRPFRFTLLVPDQPGFERVAVYVKEKLRQVDVRMDLQPMEEASSFSARTMGTSMRC